MIAEWLSMRHLIDCVLAAALLELALLAIYRWRTGKGLRLSGIAANLAAGLCLMLAVRAVLHGAAIEWVAVLLLGAGIAHALDMKSRWPKA